MRFISLVFVLVALTRHAQADCVSYGLDFVNGGSYFIDNTLATNLTFLSEFQGCDTDTVVPILVDPDENEYFCSEIPTTPDLTSFLSTCPILQTAIFDGTWYIVIEGLSFAFVRTFDLTVGTPVTVTATPTNTVGITSTPDAITSTTTSTISGSTELPPSTTTVPCKTIQFTSIIFPSPVKVTVVRTITFTKTVKTTSKTTSDVITSTAACTSPPYKRAPDPTLTQTLRLSHTTVTPALAKRAAHNAAHKRVKDMPFRRDFVDIVRRGPDSPTVTVSETTFTATVTTTSTLPAETETQTTFTTTLSTITPAAITKCSGITKVTYTTTAKAWTLTSLSIVRTTVSVTKTINVGHTRHVKTTPKAIATSCIAGGGSI